MAGNAESVQLHRILVGLLARCTKFLFLSVPLGHKQSHSFVYETPPGCPLGVSSVGSLQKVFTSADEAELVMK